MSTATAPIHRPVTPHSILSDKLSQLQQELLMRGSDLEILELVQQCRDLADPLDAYLYSSSSKPSAVLQELEEETNSMDWDSAFAKADTEIPLEREMLSGAVEGQFLKMMVALTKAKYVLEIGSFTSYASLAMAEALPDNGKLIACEYDGFTAKFARRQLNKSSSGKKVDIRVGDAMDTLNGLRGQDFKFDLIFIDADKKGYARYYTYIMDNDLLSQNGLICVDNTLYMGQAYKNYGRNENGNAIAQFNEMIAADERVQKVLIPLRDGVTLIRRCE